ncbi:unnamed protein product [Ranitomeya imitator]|uniref:G-protein coupled receptors family 1 profile domain-containing protein n=1 Tax=Ranitomeya imitator TaxID=111125 RepID=A0ABN9M5T6_9NEOB|nr:unnamed protein product [Ranitomeya imitator]
MEEVGSTKPQKIWCEGRTRQGAAADQMTLASGYKVTKPHQAMSTQNESFYQPTTFILIGIPGLEVAEIWISIPICFMYIVTILGNSAMLLIILPQETFHKPMYLFLCMLSIIDLVASASTTPKILSIFWFDDKLIDFRACLVQLFFIHALSMMESTVLLAMAFDRYVAICYPLRYTSILPNSVIAKIGGFSNN